MMLQKVGNGSRCVARWSWAPMVLFLASFILLSVFAIPQVHAFTLRVVDGNTGADITENFRWLVEVDNTYEVAPQQPVTNALGFNVHNSYAPIAALQSGDPAKGANATSGVIVDVAPNERYFVSILPNGTYSNSGVPVKANQSEVIVFVNAMPTPTAQISIYAFLDMFPINNAPDDPNEPGLGGATILISDAAGTLWQDAWGNPLGTFYQMTNGQFDLDAEGVPVVSSLGDGVLTTITQAEVNDPAVNPYGLKVGEQLIKFLPPGKYGLKLIPPNDGKNYQLTSTIEGTPTVDAWVQADEGSTFIEQFGVSFYHTFFGFVVPEDLPWAVTPPTGLGSISGTNRFNHFSRPPNNQGFFAGPEVDSCWVGVNDTVTGQGLYAAPCEADSSFSITSVPDGQYELVTWDTPLDALFGYHLVNIPELDAAGVPTTNRDINQDWLSFRWFGSVKGSVFLDLDEDGFRDPSETSGLMMQAVNLRYRDGTIYQATQTDIFGDYELSEVFPFFKWLTLEVDFARFKATGLTAIVDQGGAVDPADIDTSTWDPRAVNTLNPQGQFDPASVSVDPATGLFTGTPIINPNTNNNLSRTVAETGVVTQAMQLYLNQTNIVDWGKNLYGPGLDGLFGTIDDENGGISGVVYYAVTRAEDDPRFAAAEEWEPGLPNVQVALYHDDITPYGVIDCLDDLTGIPLSAADQLACTPELADVDNAPLDDFPGVGDVDHNSDGQFDYGDAVQIAWTDSWNDSKPADCIQDLPTIHGGTPPLCGDTYGTWNQVRDGIFDGGYAFFDHYKSSMKVALDPDLPTPGAGVEAPIGLQSGTYIVEAATPFGYELMKEEDKNVDYGDEFIPSLNLLAAVCVGDDHVIPAELSLFPGIAAPFYDPAAVPPVSRPLCDKRQVELKAAANAAAEFWFFTQVPKAARGVGFINNDLSAEFNDASPAFGEKASPSWLPVSFRDWAGNEVARTVSDEFGHYEVLVPSSYTVNQASPTGVTLAMHNILINDPFMQDPANPTGPRIADPNYDPNISVTPWTFQFETGKSSYIDSPVVPTAAFVGYPTTGLDIEAADAVPVIASVSGPNGGALVCTVGTQLTINSMGLTSVPNPDYDPALPGSMPTIDRDFGFGTTPGTVSIGGVNVPFDIVTNPSDSWSNSQIVITVPVGVTSGDLLITRGDNGEMNDLSVSVSIDGCGVGDVYVSNSGDDTTGDGSSGSPYASIQKGVDNAPIGGRVLVAAGIYNENVLLYKEITLQGSGEDTVINARANPPSRLVTWNAAVADLGVGPFTANEMPAIMVLGDTSVDSLPTEAGAYPGLANDFDFAAGGNKVKIDGLTLTGSTAGGGLYVVDHAYDLEISNNRINGNQGTYGGGITVGTPDNGATPAQVGNFNIHIHDNHVLKNSGVDGGGGIVVYTGTDNYLIENNTVMGNLTRGNGAGISHKGASAGGTISNNTIAFNEAFFAAPGAFAGDGGGIFIGGEFDLEDPAELGNGTGSVVVNSNLIQGNLSGAGNGGGIRLFKTNMDSIGIYNNMIVNNTAGLSAGGISMQDAGIVEIINNTVAHNDSTSTSLLAFPSGVLFSSAPRPAGIVSNIHSASMQTFSGQVFSDPILDNNIVYQNRSFLYDPSLNGGQGGLTFSSYWDYSVTGTPGSLVPSYNLMTSLTGPDTANYAGSGNIAANPLFILSYFNDLATAAVIDEGGNAITVRYTTLDTALGDYHLAGLSPAIETGTTVLATELSTDVDGDLRPQFINIDIGADEVLASAIVYPPTAVTLGEASVGDGTFTYTAAASGGTAPYEYKFLLYDPASGWAVVQNYSATATWTWDPTSPTMLPPENYYIMAYARRQGSIAGVETYTFMRHVIGPATDITLVETGVGNGTYTYTAAASGGSGYYEYKFLLYDPASGWSTVQNYSATATWTWNPTSPTMLPPDNYWIMVYARSLGSTAGVEAFKFIKHVILAPATDVTLSETAGGDGTFTYTAASSGGTAPYEYKFLLYDPASGWSTVQNYSATATWTWNPTSPTMLPPDNYWIMVYARSLGSTAGVEAFKFIKHVILAPATDVTLSETAGGDGTFTYTAVASGGSGSYEYRFLLYDPASGWSTVQNYSTDATWNWDPISPTMLPAGTYYTLVYARSLGSTASVEAFKFASHIIP